MAELEEKRRVRRRALRAAQVATLGLVMATGGCYVSNERGVERPVNEVVVAVPNVDAGPDDAGAAPVDAGNCEALQADWEAYSACCDEVMWDFNRGCVAWGPFVPPGVLV